jgi:hemolysin III
MFYGLIKETKEQLPNEEVLNYYTHLIGAFLAIIAAVMLWVKSFGQGNLAVISAIVYGLSLIALLGSSAIYHRERDPLKKKKLRILDHASIFLLIAGTYTPLTLLVLDQPKGLIYFSLEWGMAIIGIILKLFFTGKFQVLSLALYLIMGWLIIFDFAEIANKVTNDGLELIIFGGIAYTLGAVFYAFKRLRFSHSIWHLFVLAGAFLHYWFVYNFTL